jgi:hypothetical protein
MADSKSSLDIKLKRVDRIYRPGDIIEGVVLVNANKGWTHSGIRLNSEGVIHLSTTSRGIMGMGTDYSAKQINIMKVEQEVCAAGKFAEGTTEIPFEFPLIANPNQSLVESYHGVYISVIYFIQVVCERGMMKKALGKDLEFIVELPMPTKANDSEPTPFNITPESLENVNPSILSSIPKFRIQGRLHRSTYPINLPFTGEVSIEASNVPIKSLELQLVRIESVLADSKWVKEATEVQNIQIGDGNICRNLVVPMYMVFPRLFSCATTISTQFKIQFEVNLMIIFADGYIITENFPITLSREV